jgi:Rrf2 family nitric oxide-sensitive transcriptional repressor
LEGFVRLTLFTDYAFRILIHVATRDPELVTIASVARAYGISGNHLTKISHELGRAGFLQTVRGRNGGLKLARPANEIKIGEIARWGESGSALVECFDAASNRCLITPVCDLKNLLAHAQSAFFQTLDGHSLADLTTRRRELGKLLV